MWTRLAFSHSVVLPLASSLPNVLPKELDEKEAKLRVQAIITACLSFSAECGGTPAGGESVVHKLMDAMSLFCGVPG